MTNEVTAERMASALESIAGHLEEIDNKLGALLKSKGIE